MHQTLRAAAIVAFALASIAGAAAQSAVRNLADPAQLEAYRNIVAKMKARPGKHAELLRTLSAAPRPAAGGATGGDPPAINILGLSTDDGSQIATTALVVPSPDVLNTNLTLALVAADGTIIDIGVKSSTDETPIILTVGPTENKSTGPLDVVAQVHVIYKTGGPADYYQTIKSAVYPDKVTNLAPIITKDATSNSWIQVCVDRATPSTAAAPACNYVFGSVPKPPGALVPVQGSIKYPGAIDVGTNGKPKNAEAMLVVLNGDLASGPCRYADVGARFLTDPHTKVTGDTLSWSLDPAVFASSCAEPNAFYTFALAVKVDVGGQPSWGTISNAVTGSTRTTIAVPRLQVAAGCIAAGTLVTLGDGTKKAIEQLKAGDELKSQSYTLKLAASAKGRESRIVTATTEGGQHVTLSLIHPVITTRGTVQARDLQLDDVLTTAAGKAKIVKLVQEVLPEPIEVFDLVLTPPPGSTQQGWTLFAGDLLVGDGAMKAQLMAARR